MEKLQKVDSLHNDVWPPIKAGKGYDKGRLSQLFRRHHVHVYHTMMTGTATHPNVVKQGTEEGNIANVQPCTCEGK